MDYLKKLRELKKEKGLTNEDIAELADVPENTVAKIMSGTTQDPRFESVARIIIALGGSVDQILGLAKEDPDPIPSRVENVVSNYADLLKEKDIRLAEKDKTIETYKEAVKNLRKEKSHILCFIGVFVALIILILLFDLLNGNIGYFRY